VTETTSKKSAPKKDGLLKNEAAKNKALKIAEAIRVVKVHKAQNRLAYWKLYPLQDGFRVQGSGFRVQGLGVRG
jgi:hypothetical protein